MGNKQNKSNEQNKQEMDVIQQLVEQTKQSIRDGLTEFIKSKAVILCEELLEGQEYLVKDIAFLYAIEAIMDRMDDLNNE